MPSCSVNCFIVHPFSRIQQVHIYLSFKLYRTSPPGSWATPGSSITLTQSWRIYAGGFQSNRSYAIAMLYLHSNVCLFALLFLKRGEVCGRVTEIPTPSTFLVLIAPQDRRPFHIGHFRYRIIQKILLSYANLFLFLKENEEMNSYVNF